MLKKEKKKKNELINLIIISIPQTECDNLINMYTCCYNKVEAKQGSEGNGFVLIYLGNQV